MEPAPRYLLCLVLLVTLAGCGSLTDSETPTVSVTPADVPSVAGSAPGIAPDGVDAETLASAHDSALAATNYTVTVTEFVTDDGRRLRNATRRREVARNNQAYTGVRRVNATGIPTAAAAPYEAYWYNQSVTLLRFGTGPATRFQAYDSVPPGPFPDPSGRETVRSVLSAFPVRVTDVSPAATSSTNRTRHVLRSRRVAEPDSIPTPAYVGSPENATATVWVREDGIVREIRLAYDAATIGVDDRVRVTLRFRYRQIGNTSVQPPTWAHRAVAQGR